MTMNVSGRGLLLVWTDVAAEVEPAFNAWYDRDHVSERVNGIPGVLRGRRFVAYRSGPKYLAAYDMRSPAVMVSAPYLALRGNRDPDSRHWIPQFRNTVKMVGAVAAGEELAEGSVCALLVPSPSPLDPADLRALVSTGVVAQMMARAGIVAVRFGVCDAEILGLTRGLNPRTGDRFLDSVLMIEATSAQALDTALEQTDFASLAAQGLRVDAAPTCLRFRYGLHCPEAGGIS